MAPLCLGKSWDPRGWMVETMMRGWRIIDERLAASPILKKNMCLSLQGPGLKMLKVRGQHVSVCGIPFAIKPLIMFPQYVGVPWTYCTSLGGAPEACTTGVQHGT